MNVQYINALLESTLNVLATMAMVEATPGKPSLKSDDIPLGDVTGMIDLSGEQAKGSLAISFSAPAILDITEKMLGEHIEAIDATVVDVVGEITNMITGNAKRLFSEQGLDFDLTLPSTLIGHDQPLKHSVSGDPILLPLTTPSGEIYLELCFC